MRTEERETVLMIPHLLDGSVPPADGMALRTVGAELAAMNVGVTVRASLAHVCEGRLNVALGAAHLLVHATQGVRGFVVIELHV